MSLLFATLAFGARLVGHAARDVAASAAAALAAWLAPRNEPAPATGPLRPIRTPLP